MKKTRVTINDIAKLANVSKSTVSFYLNEHYDKMSDATKDRIHQAILDTGYSPSLAARSLNSKQTHLIGVIIGNVTTNFSNYIIKGLTDHVQTHDYQMILASSGFNPEIEYKCLNAINNMGVDGFIVQPTPRFQEIWDELNIGKPLVYFDTAPDDSPYMYVKSNNTPAVRQAMDQMIERGYRHFLMFMADPNDIITRQERVAGFVQSMEAHGTPYETILVDQKTPIEELTPLLETYISKYDDLCIFAASDWVLKKIYLALEPYRQLIPDRVGLLGMDSYEWSRLANPSITTIAQQAEKEGTICGELLLNSIQNHPPQIRSHILNCSLNEMDSTRKS